MSNTPLVPFHHFRSAGRPAPREPTRSWPPARQTPGCRRAERAHPQHQLETQRVQLPGHRLGVGKTDRIVGPGTVVAIGEPVVVDHEHAGRHAMGQNAVGVVEHLLLAGPVLHLDPRVVLRRGEAQRIRNLAGRREKPPRRGPIGPAEIVESRRRAGPGPRRFRSAAYGPGNERQTPAGTTHSGLCWRPAGAPPGFRPAAAAGRNGTAHRRRASRGRPARRRPTTIRRAEAEWSRSRRPRRPAPSPPSSPPRRSQPKTSPNDARPDDATWRETPFCLNRMSRNATSQPRPKTLPAAGVLHGSTRPRGFPAGRPGCGEAKIRATLGYAGSPGWHALEGRGGSARPAVAPATPFQGVPPD